MTVKTYSALANYRRKQFAALADYLPVNAGDVGAIADLQAFADAKAAVRDDTIAAYQAVFGDRANPDLLREAWAAEDVPAVTLVASTAVPDPAEPRLAITAGADDLDAKWERFMAASTEDVPAPDEDAEAPSIPPDADAEASSTVNPPGGAPGAGTQDDPALD